MGLLRVHEFLRCRGPMRPLGHPGAPGGAPGSSVHGLFEASVRTDWKSPEWVPPCTANPNAPPDRRTRRRRAAALRARKYTRARVMRDKPSDRLGRREWLGHADECGDR